MVDAAAASIRSFFPGLLGAVVVIEEVDVDDEGLVLVLVLLLIVVATMEGEGTAPRAAA